MEKQTKLPEMEVVETKEINIGKYIGTKTTIENLEVKSGKHGHYLKVQTEVLEKLEDGVEIKASMVFGLKTTEKGIVISSKGDLKKLMDSKKVTDYRELIGKDVIVISKADDNGVDWLIFN